MKQLSHHELVIFLLQVSVMLIFGRLFGEIAKKLKQPAVVGELIAGILLGPTILGMLLPEFSLEIFPRTGANPIALHGLTTISVILLLFIAGMEVELPMVFGQGKRAVYTSLLGIIIPFSLGFSTFYIFPDLFNVSWERELIFALFLGTALSISALPVIARTLMDLGIYKSPLGMLIISSAMVDDFLGWMIFSVILGMMNTGISGTSVLFTIASTIVFAGLLITVGRRTFDRVLPWISQHLSFPGGILSFAITMGFLGATFTESIGLHAVFGAFIVGIALGDSVHMSSKTKSMIHDFVTNVFAPLFFVAIGLKVNFITNFNLLLVSLILVVSFAGKIIGCGLGAYLGGFGWRESLAVGFGMNARGAMEIILASLALQFGVIDQQMFVALVIMALLTSISSGYLMRLFMTAEVQSQHRATGVIVFGDNPVGHYVARQLLSQKISVLLTDASKIKLTTAKSELLSYQGQILQKGVIDRLDLHRYGFMLALSDNDEANEEACLLFGRELGEEATFRLISRREAQSASLSLPENLLFRGVHWYFSNLQRVLLKNPRVSRIAVESEDSLNKFIAFSNNRKRIVPLFIQRHDKRLIPISSENTEVEDGDNLIYIDLHKDALPKSIKPSQNGKVNADSAAANKETRKINLRF